MKQGLWIHVHVLYCSYTKAALISTTKYYSDESIERYRSRLVARGYTQTYRFLIQKTFVLVEKLNTIRVLIYLVVNLGWDLQEYDIKYAYLDGELEEGIYMHIPHGYE